MLINKSYIGTHVQFTTNIVDRMINPYIENCEIETVRPVIGDVMTDAILVISDTDPAEWSDTTAYATLVYVIYQDEVYKWLQPGTGQNPETATAYWEPSPLGTFWWQFVKPWVVFDSMQQFAAYHGINITQFGVRVAESTNDFPVDGQTRASIIAMLKRSAGVRQSRMLKELKDIDWTIDTVEYEVDKTAYKPPKRYSGIRAGGKKPSV